MELPRERVSVHAWGWQTKDVNGERENAAAAVVIL